MHTRTKKLIIRTNEQIQVLTSWSLLLLLQIQTQINQNIYTSYNSIQTK